MVWKQCDQQLCSHFSRTGIVFLLSLSGSCWCLREISWNFAFAQNDPILRNTKIEFMTKWSVTLMRQLNHNDVCFKWNSMYCYTKFYLRSAVSMWPKKMIDIDQKHVLLTPTIYSNQSLNNNNNNKIMPYARFCLNQVKTSIIRTQRSVGAIHEFR